MAKFKVNLTNSMFVYVWLARIHFCQK